MTYLLSWTLVVAGILLLWMVRRRPQASIWLLGGGLILAGVIVLLRQVFG